MANVKVKNLVKKFGSVIAVNRISFEVMHGEFLALLGPSGCGKTTTLRCIAGLETPDEGDIYIDDDMVNGLPPRDRDVAMVFQSYALYPHMTVFDNIAFPLKMRKIPRNEIKRKVKSVAELLKIDHVLNKRPAQLSGGEAQRVALGRAIVRNPKVFLMDEPLSNLDAKLRVYMRAELKKLQKDLGVTTIHVTHDQVEAMTMADKIAIMNKGIILQIGSPEEVYGSPKNLFVASFIGSPPMNFIECSFLEKDRNYFIDAGVFTLPLEEKIGEIVKIKKTSSELILGIRPEHISISKNKVPSAHALAKVYVLEPLGSEIIIDLVVGENFIKAKGPPNLRIEAGENVWLSFNMNKIHIFDKKTELAIV